MAAPRTPPINHVLKIILAGVMMWAGLNTLAILPDGPLPLLFAIAVGLAAMLLLMSGFNGLRTRSQENQSLENQSLENQTKKSNGNPDARG